MVRIRVLTRCKIASLLTHRLHSELVQVWHEYRVIILLSTLFVLFDGPDIPSHA